MAILKTAGLSINFGELWAVNKVDFEIDYSQIVGLIGPNGSGKTTFLNIVSGIYGATQGSVHLAEEEITNLRPFEIYQRGISRTYQSSRLCWDLSVADNLLVGTYTSQGYSLFDAIFKPKKVNNIIYDYLQESLDLLSYFNPDLIDKRYVLAKNIPHIDRRRIEITRAMMGKPKVLLLDEPTAGLNDEETMEMMDDIRKIKEKMQDIAIIIIEHDMKVMEEVPERIVVFNAGAKIFEGVYDEMLQDKGVVDAYIGGAQ
ncbi:MAG: ABC transporter ATP-binding protein [Lachnospiraceae bacterium]|jgi:ABC-type branched-subunit amino acid transport system ATPase component|nr:ABC transporter ATP-binding protein [Lachnospiraceae bacterium]